MGAIARGNTIPPPVVEVSVPVEAQEQSATVDANPHPSMEVTQGPPPAMAIGVEQPDEREQEPPFEEIATGEPMQPGIIDFASLLGAPTITVVQLTL